MTGHWTTTAKTCASILLSHMRRGASLHNLCPFQSRGPTKVRREPKILAESRSPYDCASTRTKTFPANAEYSNTLVEQFPCKAAGVPVGADKLVPIHEEVAIVEDKQAVVHMVVS